MIVDYTKPRIEVKNYRYAWNGLTRSRASYTEYEFWNDNILIHTVTSGYRFNRASQFAKKLEIKYSIGAGEIEILKRVIILHDFLPNK